MLADRLLKHLFTISFRLSSTTKTDIFTLSTFHTHSGAVRSGQWAGGGRCGHSGASIVSTEKTALVQIGNCRGGTQGVHSILYGKAAQLSMCVDRNLSGGEEEFLMQWGLQILPDAVVVRIFGLADHALGEMFEKAAERAMSLENRKVLVDFSDVESMGPMGLTMCAYGLYHLQQLGIPVALVQPPASLFPVLCRHGMQQSLPVFSHTYDARTMN